MTAEEAQALTETAVQRLTADPAQWRAWATTWARFHEYSAGNALLIWVQRPDATWVAGYRAWQALGRQVQRGERGIGILAPVRARGAEAAAAEGDDTERPVVAFRPATVFDIAQTQGRALELPAPQPLAGRALDDWLQHCLTSGAVGVPVILAPIPDPHTHGYWSPAEHRIVVAADRAPDQQVKTLLHEWSHSLGVPDAQAAAERHRGSEEIVAETTAYVLAQRLGLDTEAYSLQYVGAWSHGDPKPVIAATQDIAARVRTMSQALDQAAARDPVIARSWAGRPAGPTRGQHQDQVEAEQE